MPEGHRVLSVTDRQGNHDVQSFINGIPHHLGHYLPFRTVDPSDAGQRRHPSMDCEPLRQGDEETNKLVSQPI